MMSDANFKLFCEIKTFKLTLRERDAAIPTTFSCQ